MIIEQFKYFSFELPFKQPFITSKAEYLSRKGFIIKLEDEQQNFAYGESSPLPEFGLDNYNDVKTTLDKLFKDLNSHKIDITVNNIFNQFEYIIKTPSVAFAIEQAMVSLLINRNEYVFTNDSSSKILINGVAGIYDLDKTIQRIDKLISDGYKTIKLKVGRDDISEDIKIITKVSDLFSKKIKLRLDANGKWNLNNAIKILEIIRNCKIEFIEQPIENLDDLFTLVKKNMLPLATDESIKNIIDAKNVIINSKINFIVLKPSIFGRINDTLEIIKLAEVYNKQIIISSAFESCVGRSTLIYLASLVKGSIAHGLSTGDFFEYDLCPDPYRITNGEISFERKTYPPEFDLNKFFTDD